MALSRLHPRWLRARNMIPRWMGMAEGEIGQQVSAMISATRWFPTNLEFLKKKIRVRVNFITVEQGDDVIRVQPNVIRRDFIKPKYVPHVEVYNVDIKTQ